MANDGYVGNLWMNYQVEFHFKVPIFGSWPAAPSTIKSFVEQKIKRGKLKLGRGQAVADKIKEAEDLLPSAKEEIDQRTLIFRRVPVGYFRDNELVKKEKKLTEVLAFPGGNIRSHIKDCATELSSDFFPKRQKGEDKSLASRVRKLYVVNDWVPIVKGGKLLGKGEFFEEFPIHVRDGRTGVPINSLKQCEGILNPVSISFTLQVMGYHDGSSSSVSKDELELIFSYGGEHGFGQERSRQYGRYEFTLTPLFSEETEKKSRTRKIKNTSELFPTENGEIGSFVPIGIDLQ